MFEERVIWARRDDGAFCRAIPSITVTAAGTILAFSEARLSDDIVPGEDVMYDEVPSHLAVKRSQDLGATWSATTLLEQADGRFWAAAGRPGKLECWSQCCPVADLRSGRLFVFYVLNEGAHEARNLQRFSRVFVRESDDDGRTWSHRREVTDIFAADDPGRAFHICIGHGLQLASGRLIAPFWGRRSLAHPPADRGYGIELVASDDGGASWRVLLSLWRRAVSDGVAPRRAHRRNAPAERPRRQARRVAVALRSAQRRRRRRHGAAPSRWAGWARASAATRGSPASARALSSPRVPTRTSGAG